MSCQKHRHGAGIFAGHLFKDVGVKRYFDPVDTGLLRTAWYHVNKVNNRNKREDITMR